MSDRTDAAIEEFLRQNERKELLRFSTAGSVDDGKSTLIGRLLHDAKGIYEDHLASVKAASAKGSAEGDIDYALVTDGLKAEREQGITIDVAYRYFSTPRRKFIIADTPGHEQYTRNMATGASTANLAIILIDAQQGVLVQSRRHAFIASLLGIPHLIVAVNKMDLVGYDEAVFEAVRAEFSGFAAKLGIVDVRFIPISALKGDNVVERSGRMPWFRGESLLEVLETIHISSDRNLIDMRFPVQYVLRPDRTYRGYCGSIASGLIRPGDEVMVLPSMKTTRVTGITSFDGDRELAFPPMSVAITLADQVDISRGDMLVHPHNVPKVERHFEAMVVWMSEAPMDLARPYLIKHTTRTTRVRIDAVRYQVDVNTLHRLPCTGLELNAIGRVVFTANQPLFYDPYSRNRSTGCFILVDPISNNTVAAGMIIDREPSERLPARMESAAAEPRAPLQRHDSRVGEAERSERLAQRPATIWLTGLVGSGKTGIAYALERRIFDLGGLAAVLDGSNFRMGLSRDLDFSTSGIAEHLRRVAETARLMNQGGLIAICAFASPVASLRAEAGAIVGRDRFIEVHVDAPLEWCEAHDRSGLYARARAGEIRNLAGVDLPYEPPAQPDLVIPADRTTADAAVERILEILRGKGIFPRPRT